MALCFYAAFLIFSGTFFYFNFLLEYCSVSTLLFTCMNVLSILNISLSLNC